LLRIDARDAKYDRIAEISDPNRVNIAIGTGIDFIRYSFGVGSLEPKGRQPNWGRFQGLVNTYPITIGFSISILTPFSQICPVTCVSMSDEEITI
jgi:hypothetical protein